MNPSLRCEKKLLNKNDTNQFFCINVCKVVSDIFIKIQIIRKIEPSFSNSYENDFPFYK